MTMHRVKVVLLGDSGVGKSSIVERFKYDSFDGEYKPTIGATFTAMNMKIPNSEDRIKYEIWDTAGQEIYRSLTSFYYKDASAAILAYDITQVDSYESLKFWVEELKKNDKGNIVLAIVANKADLKESEVVDPVVAKKFAQSVGGFYIRTSAKTSDGVEELFVNIASELDNSLRENFAQKHKPQNATATAPTVFQFCKMD